MIRYGEVLWVYPELHAVPQCPDGYAFQVFEVGRPSTRGVGWFWVYGGQLDGMVEVGRRWLELPSDVTRAVMYDPSQPHARIEPDLRWEEAPRQAEAVMRGYERKY